MSNMHRVDENGVITDLSKVSNSDTARRGGARLAGKGKKMRDGTSRTMPTDQRHREEDTAVINRRLRSGLRVSSTFTK